MKLYTHKLSPYSAKVRIALDEKGIAFDEVALPVRRAGIVEKPAELLAVNPRGEVPTLIDGDVRLYDSTVILEYLEERYPESPLHPEDVASRARARQLEDFGDWLLGGPVTDLLAETYRKPDEATRDAGAIAAARAALERAYDRLEAELGEGGFLVGDFGVADVACAVPITIAAFYGAPPAARHPRLRAWLERAGKRPSLVREIASMTEALESLPD